MSGVRNAIFPLLAAIVLACAESESPPKTPPELPESLWVEIAGEPFELELALDAASRHEGLSGRLSIEPNGGMLFVNTVESPQAMVMRNTGKTMATLAAEAGVGGPYFSRVFRLSFLAPDIVQAILRDRHPIELNARRLAAYTRLPIDWEDQRKCLGLD